MAGKSADRRKQTENSVSILLWNVSGSSGEVQTKQRCVSMANVLSEIKEKHFEKLMVLCTDQVKGTKSTVLEHRLQGRDRRERDNSNTDAEVFHTNDLTVGYLRSNELRPLPSERLSVTILTGKNDNKTLVASWHGRTQGEKRDLCLRVFRKLQELKIKHKCRAAIIGGDFNLNPEDVKDILETDLQHLHAEIGAQYTDPPDKQDKSKLDFLVYWPKWAFIITNTEVVFEEHRYYEDKKVFDHPIVMYTIWDWPHLDLDGRFGDDHVALRKWERAKASADFTFSSDKVMSQGYVKQLLEKLESGCVYRAEGRCVVFQGSSTSSMLDTHPVKHLEPTQLFLSRCTLITDIIRFDNKVRDLSAKNACSTVYGVFRMEGSIDIASFMADRQKESAGNFTSTTDQSHAQAASAETVANDLNSVSQQENAKKQTQSANPTSCQSEFMPSSQKDGLKTNSPATDTDNVKTRSGDRAADTARQPSTDPSEPPASAITTQVQENVPPQIHLDTEKGNVNTAASSVSQTHSPGPRQGDTSREFGINPLSPRAPAAQLLDLFSRAKRVNPAEAKKQTSLSKTGQAASPQQKPTPKRKAQQDHSNPVKKSKSSAGFDEIEIKAQVKAKMADLKQPDCKTAGTHRNDTRDPPSTNKSAMWHQSGTKTGSVATSMSDLAMKYVGYNSLQKRGSKTKFSSQRRQNANKDPRSSDLPQTLAGASRNAPMAGGLAVQTETQSNTRLLPQDDSESCNKTTRSGDGGAAAASQKSQASVVSAQKENAQVPQPIHRDTLRRNVNTSVSSATQSTRQKDTPSANGTNSAVPLEHASQSQTGTGTPPAKQAASTRKTLQGNCSPPGCDETKSKVAGSSQPGCNTASGGLPAPSQPYQPVNTARKATRTPVVSAPKASFSHANVLHTQDKRVSCGAPKNTDVVTGTIAGPVYPDIATAGNSNAEQKLKGQSLTSDSCSSFLTKISATAELSTSQTTLGRKEPLKQKDSPDDVVDLTEDKQESETDRKTSAVVTQHAVCQNQTQSNTSLLPQDDSRSCNEMTRSGDGDTAAALQQSQASVVSAQKENAQVPQPIHRDTLRRNVNTSVSSATQSTRQKDTPSAFGTNSAVPMEHASQSQRGTGTPPAKPAAPTRKTLQGNCSPSNTDVATGTTPGLVYPIIATAGNSNTEQKLKDQSLTTDSSSSFLTKGKKNETSVAGSVSRSEPKAQGPTQDNTRTVPHAKSLDQTNISETMPCINPFVPSAPMWPMLSHGPHGDSRHKWVNSTGGAKNAQNCMMPQISAPAEMSHSQTNLGRKERRKQKESPNCVVDLTEDTQYADCQNQEVLETGQAGVSQGKGACKSLVSNSSEGQRGFKAVLQSCVAQTAASCKLGNTAVTQPPPSSGASDSACRNSMNPFMPSVPMWPMLKHGPHGDARHKWVKQSPATCSKQKQDRLDAQLQRNVFNNTHDNNTVHEVRTVQGCKRSNSVNTKSETFSRSATQSTCTTAVEKSLPERLKIGQCPSHSKNTNLPFLRRNLRRCEGKRRRKRCFLLIAVAPLPPLPRPCSKGVQQLICQTEVVHIQDVQERHQQSAEQSNVGSLSPQASPSTRQEPVHPHRQGDPVRINAISHIIEGFYQEIT